MAVTGQRTEFRDFFLMLDALHDWLQECGEVYPIDRRAGTAYRERWGVMPYMVFTVPPNKAPATRMRQRIVEFAAAAAIRKHGLEKRPYFLSIPPIHYEVQQVAFYPNDPVIPACLSREDLLAYLHGLAALEPGSELEQALDFVSRHPHFAQFRRTLHPERAYAATIHYSNGSLARPDVHCNGIILVGDDIRLRFPETTGIRSHSEAFQDPAFVLNGLSYYCQPEPLTRVETLLDDFHSERPDAWL